MRAGFATIVAFSLFIAGGACGGKDGHAPRSAKSAGTCIPAGADVGPSRMVLTGATFTFCLAASAGNPYCFMADLEARTIVPASAPPDASGDSRSRKDFPLWRANGANPASASLEPSAHGKGLTACTHDKATCHDLPIDAASIGDKPTAVSEDATLVAIDMRSHANDSSRSPGRLETWDAVTGKKLASFEIHYGPTTTGYESPNRILDFLGHTLIAFTESACALPCSSATMYSVRGKYVGMLAADPTGARAEPFHDELYVLYSPGPELGFVVQDMATGKTLQPDTAENWAAVVTPDRIVGVIGGSHSSPTLRPRVEVWGPDLKLVTTIAVPMCAAAPTNPAGGS